MHSWKMQVQIKGTSWCLVLTISQTLRLLFLINLTDCKVRFRNLLLAVGGMWSVTWQVKSQIMALIILNSKLFIQNPLKSVVLFSLIPLVFLSALDGCWGCSGHLSLDTARARATSSVPASLSSTILFHFIVVCGLSGRPVQLLGCVFFFNFS